MKDYVENLFKVDTEEHVTFYVYDLGSPGKSNCSGGIIAQETKQRVYETIWTWKRCMKGLTGKCCQVQRIYDVDDKLLNGIKSM